MSLFGTLNTSVSGMAAQATVLSTIGDNIANASTTGYKDASTQFETLLGNLSASDYQSGGVQSQVRYGITQQGTIEGTSSSTDLAVSGNGFFVVEDSSGAQVLTRAGSFVPDSSGDLVNAAGYKLLGYDLANGTSQSGSSGLQVVNIAGTNLAASPSTAATLSVNMPSSATAVVPSSTVSLPSANQADSVYTSKTSLTAYDNIGTPIALDVYMTKTGPVAPATGNPTWEVSFYNAANASASGGFPYSAGPLKTQTLTFDQQTGDVTGLGTLSVQIPNGNAVSIDMSQSTQLDANFGVNTDNIDGSSPAKVSQVNIGKDGIVTEVYSNGIQKNTYQVALATVASPDLLTSESGNVYTTNAQSGTMIVDQPESNGMGQIDSSSVEDSTVDLATELTNMISAQRSYEANSKVLQTASDLLGVLNNIQIS